jgi:hypothetical protein
MGDYMRPNLQQGTGRDLASQILNIHTQASGSNPVQEIAGAYPRSESAKAGLAVQEAMVQNLAHKGRAPVVFSNPARFAGQLSNLRTPRFATPVNPDSILNTPARVEKIFRKIPTPGMPKVGKKGKQSLQSTASLARESAKKAVYALLPA